MIIAVTSWRGLGTTTTSLLLAVTSAASGRPTWLVEADPAGGVLAGRVSLPPAAVGGLERRCFPGAENLTLADVSTQWHGLTLVSAPADPFRAHACHHPASQWIGELDALGREAVLVIDIGRMRAGSPAAPLLDCADVVLLVTSPEVSAAVGASEWLAAAGRVSALDPAMTGTDLRVVVVESPGGRAFGRSLLTSEMGEHLVGWLPWDAAVVDTVHRSGRQGRLRRRPALMTEVDRMFEHLVAIVAAREVASGVTQDAEGASA